MDFEFQFQTRCTFLCFEGQNMFLAPDPMTVVGGTSQNSKEQTLLTCLVPYEWADLTNGSMSADSPTKKIFDC